MDAQPPNFNDPMLITQIARQLDRLDERTRDLVTRADLEGLRKELVTRDAFEPHLNALKTQIERVNEDRLMDKRTFEKRLDELEAEQITRQDRLWIRLAQGIGVLAFIMALFEFVSHLKFFP